MPLNIDDLDEAVRVMRAGGAPRDITDRMEARRCGDCDFCCTAKAVSDMEPEEKPCWSRCDHLREPYGCAIYEAKPKSCSDYLCAWRLGLGRESGRPDHIGVMVDVEEVDPGDPENGIPNRLGLIVHAQAPYRMIDVRRYIEDAIRIGIYHVGFTTAEEDRSGPVDIKFVAHPKELAPMLSRHAGRGVTGWNRSSDQGGDADASED